MDTHDAAGPAGRATRVLALLAPRRDRATQRPPQLEHGLDDRPGAPQTIALACQQIAIQAIYLILPGLVAAQFGLLPIDVVNFLCLSVAGVGVAGLLQVLGRGPVGSGYPVASIPSPVFVAVYLMAAPGANLAVVSALTVVTGLAGMLLATRLRRLQKLVPTEVAGVVIFLIGLSLLPRAFAAATAPAPTEGAMRAGLAVATLALMIGLALRGGALARFAVLGGAAAGTLAALLLDAGGVPDDVLRQQPWFALPRPDFATPAGFEFSLLPAFLVALLASFASWTGDLVAFQRAADGGWRQPDTPPIRRGLIAQSLAVTLAGLVGALPPGTSSACVGLSIATRILARRVAIWSSIGLLLLACCPKLLALVLLLPPPVEAAMLGYVCCFMLAAGSQLMGSRMLDARRTFTVGIALSIGVGALLGLFQAVVLPVLHSPVTAGALAAILLNLATAPLVAQRAAFVIRPGPQMPQDLTDRIAALGGAWGARRRTMDRISHALLEVAELLARRGCPEVRLQAVHEADRILITLDWAGDRLPAPAQQPHFADLEGAVAAQESFALWLATRNAEAVEQRPTPHGWELRLAFID